MNTFKLNKLEFLHRPYIIIIICLTIGFILFSYVTFSRNYNIEGDSLSQIAFWNIIFHPEIKGSLGASQMKPALVLLFGMIYNLTKSIGVIQWVSMIFGLALVWFILNLANYLSGWRAVLTATVICLTSFFFYHNIILATSHIYFLTFLFWGLWLYGFRKQKFIGSILIASSSLFRVEGFVILGILLIYELFLKNRKNSLLIFVEILLAFGIYLIFNWFIHGTLGHADSGLAMGYGYERIALRFNNIKTTEFLITRFPKRIFLILLITILNIFLFWEKRDIKFLLIPYGIIIAIWLNVFINCGAYGDRYFSFSYPLAFSFVPAGIIFIFDKLKYRYKSLLYRSFFIISMAFFLFFLIWISHPFTHAIKKSVVMMDNLVDEFIGYSKRLYTMLPEKAKVMMDDDILSCYIVHFPDRLTKARSLQKFNIENNINKKIILADIEYIYLVRGKHYFYYINYIASPEWLKDNCRLIFNNLWRSNQPSQMLNVYLSPQVNTQKELLLKVRQIKK